MLYRAPFVFYFSNYRLKGVTLKWSQQRKLQSEKKILKSIKIPLKTSMELGNFLIELMILSLY